MRWRIVLLVAAFSVVSAARAGAAIQGISGGTFSLTAKEGYISASDGNMIYMWGYAQGDSPMQYPGPTLIVDQGTTVTVNLTNQLSVAVSIVFPGQEGVEAIGGTAGLLTQEAAPNGGAVSYRFTATHPGTYQYYSGTRMDLQVDMGLVGALIVRPGITLAVKGRLAYEHPDSFYDREYLFVMTELDHRIHQLAEHGLFDQIDNTAHRSTYFFYNGRTFPDTMGSNFSPWLPTQPYSCMPMMHPGEKVLMRLVSAGRGLHPHHTHGNNFTIIARDGRLLSSEPGVTGADLQESDFTTTVPPGGTLDATITWTGEKLGWDIYGHSPDDPLEPYEYVPDHGKPFPVKMPDNRELQFGALWSGSPFLGRVGGLPPGEGGFNLAGGYFHMWHSHKEKELLNWDTFPGGMITLIMIVPHSVNIAD